MQAGRRDHKITIEQKTITRNNDGSESVSWSEYKKFWAEKIQGQGTESFQIQQKVAENETAWKILYDAGITKEMRIKETDDNNNDVIYDITGIMELQRRRGLEIKSITKDAQAQY